MTIPTPPDFDETYWTLEPNPPPGYTGITFNFEFFTRHVKIDTERRVVGIGDIEMKADHLQTGGPIDTNYPLYFEITRKNHHYTFSVWSNRISIEVHRHENVHYELLDVMFPATEDELLQALTRVVRDLN
jgi:hypothetical protein